MSDFLDDYFAEPVQEPSIKDKVLEHDSKLNRGDYYGSVAKCIMQFPKRFYEMWVLQPYEFDYVDEFNKGKRSFWFENNIILSSWERKSGRRIPVRDYSWLLDVLKGTEKTPSLFNALKVLGSDNDLDGICSLLDTIMAEGDIKFNDLWRVSIDSESFVFTQKDITNWFSFLKSIIPVRLVDENQMPPVALPPRGGRTDDDYLRTMELLGVYRCFPNAEKYYDVKKGIWYNEKEGRVECLKEILICPKRIRDCAEKYSIKEVKNLFIVVYLHELAHAILDSMIIVNEEDLYQDTKKYTISFDGTTLESSKHPSSFAMEESLANMIMLKYIDWYTEVEPDFNNLYEDAMKFVGCQIEEYKFGIKQFEADVDWTKWRQYKSKHKEPDDKLDEWFNNYFNKEDYIKEYFDKVFK